MGYQRINTKAHLARRQFLQTMGITGLTAALFPLSSWGSQDQQSTSSATALTHISVNRPTELRGTECELELSSTLVNITGKTRLATLVNGQLPGPTLYWREGETVTIRVTNRLAVTSSIHWHGILLPAHMDGVPGLSFKGIAPGETFVYRFLVKQSGTYWYHSHSGFQEQTGLRGAIVIEPHAEKRIKTDRDVVIMLSDWTDDVPETIYYKLKKMSDFFNYKQPTVQDFIHDISQTGLKAALKKRSMWNRMRMMPTDFSDVSVAPISGIHFTYLMNGLSSEKNWTVFFKPGEKIRLRIINGSSTTIFDVRIPGLTLTIIAADGQDVQPVEVDEFRISVAEVYDVLIEPHDNQAYTIFAQSIGRSGYVHGTLTAHSAMQAEIPEMDTAQWLTMTDMMGSMAAMPSTEHHKSSSSSDPHHAGMQHILSENKSPAVTHVRSEYGPNVDMHVDMPRINLDDPGINLRNNGRRALTYADLHTIGGPLDTRLPTRTIELHLTGHMERFIWSFDGQKFSEALPLHFRYGERLRLVLVNDTMMNHPIHLHGMWSELETPEGDFQVRKHTINVQPAQRVAYRITADTLGHWAFHCHLLYHMESGMFREVVVS